MKVILPTSLTYGTPATGFSRASPANYFDSNLVLQQAPANSPRIAWDPETGNLIGLLLEPAMTNLLLNTEVLSAQSVSVLANVTYTLSFWGTGTVFLSGVGLPIGASLPGRDVYPNKRVSYSFTPTSNGFLSITVSGTVQKAQLEAHAVADWSSTRSYSLNTEAVYNGIVYKSLQNSNLGNQPDVSSSFWQYVRQARTYPTSYLASGSTQSTRAADIIYSGTDESRLYGIFYSDFPDINAEWSSSVSYNIDNLVTYKGATYRSLTDANVNNAPIEGETSTNWFYVSASNQYAAFDSKVSIISQSSKPGDSYRYIVFMVKREARKDALDSVGVAGMQDVDTVYCGISSVIESAYSKNILTAGFDDPGENVYFQATDVAPERLLVTLCFKQDAPTANAFQGPSVAEIVTGSSMFLGNTNYGLSFSIVDYSKKDEDEFGNIQFLKRGNKKTLSCSVDVLKNVVSSVFRRMRTIVSVPTMWIASEDEDYEAFAVIYGHFTDFQKQINYPTHATCSLEIEEVL